MSAITPKRARGVEIMPTITEVDSQATQEAAIRVTEAASFSLSFNHVYQSQDFDWSQLAPRTDRSRSKKPCIKAVSKEYADEASSSSVKIEDKPMSPQRATGKKEVTAVKIEPEEEQINLRNLLNHFKIHKLWGYDLKTLSVLSNHLPQLMDLRKTDFQGNLNLMAEFNYRLAQAFAGKKLFNTAIELLEKNPVYSLSNYALFNLRLKVFLHLYRDLHLPFDDSGTAEYLTEEYDALCKASTDRGRFFRDVAIEFSKVGRKNLAVKYFEKAKNEEMFDPNWKDSIEVLQYTF